MATPKTRTLTVAQAAKRLGISRQAAHQLIQRGALGGTRVAATRWVVDESSVEDRLRTIERTKRKRAERETARR